MNPLVIADAATVSETRPDGLPGPEMALQVHHQGRGGYIALEGLCYPIEHVGQGHFAIHFPAGQAARPSHLAALAQFAERQVPAWYVENKSLLTGGQGRG